MRCCSRRHYSDYHHRKTRYPSERCCRRNAHSGSSASVIRVIIIIADFARGWVEDSVTASGNGAVRIAVNCLATVITGFDTDFDDRVTAARDGAGVGAAVAIIPVTIIAEFWPVMPSPQRAIVHALVHSSVSTRLPSSHLHRQS